MGKISNGRDQRYPSPVIYEGREFRSTTIRDAYISDKQLTSSRQTPTGRRPVKRKP